MALLCIFEMHEFVGDKIVSLFLARNLYVLHEIDVLMELRR